jgi:hypothetical protein
VLSFVSFSLQLHAVNPSFPHFVLNHDHDKFLHLVDRRNPGPPPKLTSQPAGLAILLINVRWILLMYCHLYIFKLLMFAVEFAPIGSLCRKKVAE